MIRPQIREYVEREIIPRYDLFDAAHRRDHATSVIEASVRYAQIYNADVEMAYVLRCMTLWLSQQVLPEYKLVLPLILFHNA